jgi:hypothetical protein
VPLLIVRLVYGGLNGIATNLFAYVNYELAILVSYNTLQYKKYDVCVHHKVQIEMPVIEMDKYADDRKCLYAL